MLGTEFSLIQELYFPDKTHHQIKLKYKKEDRQHPSLLKDALCNHAKDYSLLIELVKVKLASPNSDASDFKTAEEVVDLTTGTNEVATSKEDADVKAQEDLVAVHSPEESDEDDDFQKWSHYKSFY